MQPNRKGRKKLPFNNMFSILVLFVEQSCGCCGKIKSNSFMTYDKNKKIKEKTWND